MQAFPISNVKNPRVRNLIETVQRDFNNITSVLGWDITFLEFNEQHGYVVFSISRDAVIHKVGYLYSQSTDKAIYRKLENCVEYVFVKGMDFKLDNIFSRDCKIPVLPDNDFYYVMTDWNMDYLHVNLKPSAVSYEIKSSTNKETIRIIEENPLQQVYTHLQALTSKIVAKQSVVRHANRNGVTLAQNVIESKAEGVSYLVQNAIDYYANATTSNITQRMLNLYYGTIALMEAEMLIYGTEYSRLAEIEKITKFGHGLATFGDANNLKDFYVGVLDKGLFQAWLAHRGVDVDGFPDSRKNSEKSDFKISLDDLLCHIPELQNIMQESEADFKPFFLFPNYDLPLNHASGLKKSFYKRKYVGSYVNFLNLEGKRNPDWEKQLLESFLAPITIVGDYKDNSIGGWRTFVMHHKDAYHYESYNIHKGLSASMVIAPLFGRIDNWEVFAVMILYALSIIVRYMPNLWTRVLHGDLDYYKAVFYQFSRVAERELVQIFLEKLTGKEVLITHPQGLI